MTARSPASPVLRPAARLLASALGILLLAGCEQVNQRLGLEDPAKKEARLEAEGKAVGSGCRQSGRAIEDCYSLYNWLPKAAIFAGWREMNDYMLANKLTEVEPRLPPASAPENARKRRKVAEDAGEAAAADAATPAPEAREATEKPAATAKATPPEGGKDASAARSGQPTR